MKKSIVLLIVALVALVALSACTSATSALKITRLAQPSQQVAQFTAEDHAAAVTRANALGHPERAHCYDLAYAWVSGGKVGADLPIKPGAAMAVELANEAKDVQDEPIPDDIVQACAPVILRTQELRRQLLSVFLPH